MRTFFLIIALILCSTQLSFSQEDGVVSLAIPVRSSLKFNRYLTNPTFSFVREQNTYINITNKREWIQFEDAPVTYLINYSGRYSENMGVGVGLFQQNHGVLTTFGGIVNLAYNAQLQTDSNLTFGLNLGFYTSSINEGSVVLNEPDPSLDNISKNSIFTVSPGINYGLVFFDIGVSVNNLVQYNLKSSELLKEDPQRSIQAHVMYTGYMYSRGFFDESKFSALVKSEFKTDQTIFSGVAMLMVPKGIWAQLGYNTVYGVTGGIGMNVTEQISVEYNYEKAMGDLATFGSSHEFTLAYKFNTRNRFKYSGDDREQALLIKKQKKRTLASSSSNSKLDADAKAELAEQKVLELEEKRLAIEAKAIAREEAKEEARIEREAKATALAESQDEGVNQTQADEEARLTAEAAAAEEDRLAAEVTAQAQADEEARLAAVATAEEARLAAEATAQAQAAEEARLAAEATAEAQSAEEARLAAEATAQAQAAEEARLAAEAIAQAQVAEEARLAAEATAQAQAAEEARLAAEATAQAQAAEEARLAAVATAQAQAAEDARLAAETTAQDQVAEEARLAAEATAQAQAVEEARLAAEATAQDQVAEEARLAAETLAIETNVAITQKDDLAKSMYTITESTKDSEKEQEILLVRLNEVVISKNKDLKDLKEENDLSEQGIYMEPKPFKSISAENRAMEAIKSDLDIVINKRNEDIKNLENLYIQRIQKGSNKNDETTKYYLETIRDLKADQAQAERTRASLVSTLESIKLATEIERKRRIKRALYDNEKDRYNKDMATLERIKNSTPISTVPFTAEDFDSGEEQSSNVQILKGVQNVDNGYYMIVAVHKNVSERDAFLEKAISAGQSNINFFFDVNSSKYFIYYQKFDYVEEAMRALETKGDKPYNQKMSVVKIED
ncbi:MULTISPECIES: PorP/SprF family type IX secretion system membrane protein [Bizionia]|uniref:Type IX secretion system membrane protein PorP/SprF n=1 Tax=Bizionia algoritergicola TaxID=291187 RepID=A0A5D0QWZ8_9FLAO|nr:MULTISPECIES: PorP/SprF family type IX secretion system membrane protein [Bizionia]TYB73305.1 type IX secretion system membrane protein PorP/SprF [Bizionia algoritergicola]